MSFLMSPVLGRIIRFVPFPSLDLFYRMFHVLFVTETFLLVPFCSTALNRPTAFILLLAAWTVSMGQASLSWIVIRFFPSFQTWSLRQLPSRLSFISRAEGGVLLRNILPFFD